MKILIPLTVLVLSFIIYYFFSTPISSTSKKVPPLSENVSTFKEKSEMLAENFIPSLASMKIQPRPQNSIQTDKVYLTLDDLKNKKFKSTGTDKDKQVSQKSYNQMIFQRLKTLLQQASSTYYAKKHIVLNSRISSILTSQNARDKFKTALATDFGLDDETIEQELKRNRTVWDWVTFLSP